MSDELTALAVQAGQLDAESQATSPQAIQQQQEEQEQQQQEIDLLSKNAAAIGMMLDLAAPTLGLFKMPTAGKVLADPRNKETLVNAWAPVLTKYAIDISMWGDKYKEEIGACFATWPVVAVLIQAIKHDAENPPKEIGRVSTAPAAAEMPKGAGQAAPIAAEPVKLG